MSGMWRRCCGKDGMFVTANIDSALDLLSQALNYICKYLNAVYAKPPSLSLALCILISAALSEPSCAVCVCTRKYHFQFPIGDVTFCCKRTRKNHTYTHSTHTQTHNINKSCMWCAYFQDPLHCVFILTRRPKRLNWGM